MKKIILRNDIAKKRKKLNYNSFIINNLEALTQNYKSRLKFIHETPFWEYCDYIYTGIKNGCYIPKEYLKNIKENK